jgi:Prophage tail length tape measure protein
LPDETAALTITIPTAPVDAVTSSFKAATAAGAALESETSRLQDIYRAAGLSLESAAASTSKFATEQTNIVKLLND